MPANIQETKICGDDCKSFNSKRFTRGTFGTTDSEKGTVRIASCRAGGGMVKEKSPCVILIDTVKGKVGTKI